MSQQDNDPVQQNPQYHQRRPNVYPKDKNTQDTLQSDLAKQQRTGHPVVRARVASMALDTSTFAVLVRIDTMLQLRKRINDDSFILDEIDSMFTRHFEESLSR
jgi:hypothetical protein